jgi:hypothetical protein
MREINAAWEVLRNPAARARYDDELKEQAAKAREPERVRTTSVFDNTGAAPGTAPPSPVRARPKVISLEPDDVADLAPADDPSEPVKGSRWLMWGPVLIGGTVLVFVLIAAVVSARPNGSSVKIQTVEEFGVGTCVSIITDPATVSSEPGAQAAPAVLSARCTEPHNGKVVALENVPRPCPKGSTAFSMPGDAKRSVCVVTDP